MSVLCYPKEVQNSDLHPATMSFKFFDRQSMTKSIPLSDVVLYMPESASNPSTVSWGQEKFGYIGANIASGAANVKNGTPGEIDFNRLIGDGATFGAYKALSTFGSKLANLLGGNVSAEGLMGEVTGKIPNPYLTMVFQGVDFRSFAFTFKFTPYSEDDCQVIDRIIKTFRQASLPSRNAEAGGGSLLNYPQEVEIQYNWQGSKNQWLPRFKRCVITAMDTDYTGNSMFSVMRNGFPTTVTVSLKFTELNIVTSEEIEGSGAEQERGGNIAANLGTGF